MKARYTSQHIEDDLNSSWGRIIVFTGARQTGKTTLVKNLFNDFKYISIEDPTTRTQYTSLTASQWHELIPKAILDEIQKEPRLIESIKSVYDQWKNVRYILLGSSQLLLMKQVKESLAGRCIIKELYPLTIPELETQSWEEKINLSPLQQLITTGSLPTLMPSVLMEEDFPKKMAAWNHYTNFGGYPALTDECRTDKERYKWLSTYVRTYLERDVRDLATFKDLEPYIKLQQITAIQTSCILNANSIAREIGVTSKTVMHYLQYLEMSYQAILLPAWDKNKAKRLSKSPKMHYMDYGVLQAVLHKQSPMPTGKEFESIVVTEIYKQIKQTETDIQFYHLRTLDGKEIDLLLETPNGYYAFEIKQTSHKKKDDARQLLSLESILDKPLLKAFVLSNDPMQHQYNEKTIAISVVQMLG